jgi:hypothetical protein
MKVWIVIPFVLSLAAAAMPCSPERSGTLAASEKAARSLGNEPVTVAVRLPESVAGNASRRLRVVVEGLELVHPGAVYEVYLNLPEGRKPDPEGPYFLGHLALYGQPVGGEPDGRRSFDLTDKLAALRESGDWTGEVELTFVRGNPEQAQARAAPAEFIRFSHISVVERQR